jgi:glutamate synthase domain-containing protein 1
MMMMVPEPWTAHESMSAAKKAFSDLSLEQGHAIMASTSKPHDLAVKKAIQAFALKGLGGHRLPTRFQALSIR